MKTSAVAAILIIISVALTGVRATDIIPAVKDSVATEELFISLVKLIGNADSIVAAPQTDLQTDTVADELPLGALDFLSSVYEENTYYDSGSWNKGNGHPETTPFTGYLPDYIASSFIAPITGKITSRFGQRPGSDHVHKGVDLSLHRGDTVRVALSGTVERIGYERGGYGHFVVVSHPDNVQTRYAHLQRPLVQRGAELQAGTPLAIGGTSGNSTGPHLHFEIRCQGHPVDPTPLLQMHKPTH